MDTLNDNTRSLLRDNAVEELSVSCWEFDIGERERAACVSDGRLIGLCASLRRLEITGFDKVSDEQEEAFQLVLTEIAKNRSIEELLLYGYGPEHCGRSDMVHLFPMLSPFFEHNHNFRRLQILVQREWDNPEETEELAAAIVECSSLKEFQLICCSDEAESLGGPLLAALKNSKSSLTQLSLRCANEWNGHARLGCARLGELIVQSSTLEELDLNYNAIDDEGAEVLGRVLGECPKLKTLRFGSIVDHETEVGTMTEDGWRAFLEFLESPTCALEELQLGCGDNDGTWWDDDGTWPEPKCGHHDGTALAVTDALKTNRMIKTLSFGGNWGITPHGWCSFFTNLLGNPNSALAHLDVSYCTAANVSNVGGDEVVDDGIGQALADALVSNRALKTVNLTRFDAFGPRGWEIIGYSLQDLVFNKESLSAVLSSNHTLFEIRWENGEYKGWLCEELMALLQLNRGDNKEEVTRQKVLRYYSSCNPNAEDDELLVRELGKDTGDKVMPFVMAWAGRGESLTTLLYRLIRRDPAVFASVNGNLSVAGKRKRRGAWMSLLHIPSFLKLCDCVPR